MKKAILLVTAILISASLFAQTTKKDTAKKVKPQYEYFVKVPVKVYQQLLETAHNYKDGLIYIQTLSDKEARQQAMQIDGGVQYLQKNFKVDSTLKK
jgi:hypothetical protein